MFFEMLYCYEMLKVWPYPAFLLFKVRVWAKARAYYRFRSAHLQFLTKIDFPVKNDGKNNTFTN